MDVCPVSVDDQVFPLAIVNGEQGSILGRDRNVDAEPRTCNNLKWPYVSEDGNENLERVDFFL